MGASADPINQSENPSLIPYRYETSLIMARLPFLLVFCCPNWEINARVLCHSFSGCYGISIRLNTIALVELGTGCHSYISYRTLKES